jgi:hypothetical protein
LIEGASGGVTIAAGSPLHRGSHAKIQTRREFALGDEVIE